MFRYKFTDVSGEHSVFRLSQASRSHKAGDKQSDPSRSPYDDHDRPSLCRVPREDQGHILVFVYTVAFYRLICNSLREDESVPYQMKLSTIYVHDIYSCNIL
jgi:hypothetical protein